MAALDASITTSKRGALRTCGSPRCRALRALSSTYIERRATIHHGAALAGAGKRAAFALFYGPLHYLTVSEVVRGLEAGIPAPAVLVNLGCGTGASGAAWAHRFAPAAGNRNRSKPVGNC